MTRKKTDTLGSFAKGLSVIEVFTADKPRLSIAEVSTLTGYDRATSRRCLLTLTALDYAAYDGKYFSLTPRIMRLGMASLAAMPLLRIVQPFLDKLSNDIGQSTSVSILDGGEIVYVARAARQSLMAINLMPGSRLPAYCTSMGRVMLAHIDENKSRAILHDKPLVKRTRHTIVKPEKLMREFARIRQQGYAIVDQEIEIGLRSIAVPLFDRHGGMIAALNVGVAAVHDDALILRDLYLPKLREVQANLRPLVN